ncbi:MAG TPA: tRNA (adenosine(37)-N6)-threonylcarbamoyltransferase complex dimerization subunit type 1 TsaB [Bacilli bacterium]
MTGIQKEGGGIETGAMGETVERENRGTNPAGKWLAIDTSTSAMTLAVFNGQSVLGESNLHAVRNHSTLLIPAIQELVKSLDMTMKDLQGIAAGKGPGSYTGVRIGVTAAKTLAWALGVPLVGVSSLEAMAYGGLCDFGGRRTDDAGLLDRNSGPGGKMMNLNQWVVPLMDARRNQAFTGLYVSEGTKWSCLAEDSIRLMTSEWAEALVDIYGQPGRIVFVGEIEPFGDIIDQVSKLVDCMVIREPAVIRARDVGLLGLGQWAQGCGQDVHGFVPNYAQLTEAEKNLVGKST